MKSTDQRNCWIKSAMPSVSNTVPPSELESLSHPFWNRPSSSPTPRLRFHSLHDLDLFARQPKQLVHELVDLPVGQLDLALNCGALRGDLGGLEGLVEGSIRSTSSTKPAWCLPPDTSTISPEMT